MQRPRRGGGESEKKLKSMLLQTSTMADLFSCAQLFNHDPEISAEPRISLFDRRLISSFFDLDISNEGHMGADGIARFAEGVEATADNFKNVNTQSLVPRVILGFRMRLLAMVVTLFQQRQTKLERMVRSLRSLTTSEAWDHYQETLLRDFASAQAEVIKYKNNFFVV